MTAKEVPTNARRAALAVLVLCVSANAREGLAQTDRPELPVIVFRNVSVVTMQGADVLREQSVVIQGERIAAIGPVETVPIPLGAVVIDGSDRYLIPGLSDMHVHVSVPFENGPLFLDAGITTVLSLGAQSTGDVRAERDRSRAPDFEGPTLYTTGPIVVGGESSREVEELVRLNAEAGFDVVKVHGDLSREAFRRLNEVANELEIGVTGHAQRRRGMAPVYEWRQDLAHVEEYLYAAFNPPVRGFVVASAGALVALVLLPFGSMLLGVVARFRARGSPPAEETSGLPPLAKGVGKFGAMAWAFFVMLGLTMTSPYPGLFASSGVAVSLVSISMLGLAYAAIRLSWKARGGFRESGMLGRVASTMVMCVVWLFILSAGYLTSHTWRTTDSGLASLAAETAASGIWVTPNLVAWDYFVRQSGEEFYSLIERPGMRYLRPETRENWTERNNARRAPGPLGRIQEPVRRSYGDLMMRLVAALHTAGVPLLAGSDVGAHGVLPGEALHEELGLLVEAGLTPYEALRTATVNAATYLGDEQEFGKVAVGFRADLVLLNRNPLDDVKNLRTRVGVMKRGRWISDANLSAVLERLAEQRR